MAPVEAGLPGREGRRPRVLVTGASGGIGRAVVAALRAREMVVVAQGRRASALRDLEQAHPGLATLRCDLTVPEEREALVPRAWQAVGELDALVQCAGVAHHQAALALDERALESTFAVNTLAPIMLARRFAAALVERRRGGAIVAIASTLARRPAPETLAYAASKAALVQALRVLALELAPMAIRVNVVSPGVVDTAMVRRQAEGLRHEQAQVSEALLKLHPIGRIGQPEDVAQAVLYLLGASWATGSDLVLDGGLTARE